LNGKRTQNILAAVDYTSLVHSADVQVKMLVISRSITDKILMLEHKMRKLKEERYNLKRKGTMVVNKYKGEG